VAADGRSLEVDVHSQEAVHSLEVVGHTQAVEVHSLAVGRNLVAAVRNPSEAALGVEVVHSLAAADRSQGVALLVVARSRSLLAAVDHNLAAEHHVQVLAEVRSLVVVVRHMPLLASLVLVPLVEPHCCLEEGHGDSAADTHHEAAAHQVHLEVGSVRNREVEGGHLLDQHVLTADCDRHYKNGCDFCFCSATVFATFLRERAHHGAAAYGEGSDRRGGAVAHERVRWDVAELQRSTAPCQDTRLATERALSTPSNVPATRHQLERSSAETKPSSCRREKGRTPSPFCRHNTTP